MQISPNQVDDGEPINQASAYWLNLLVFLTFRTRVFTNWSFL